jgi:PIN domain nuclease of toxin-antitoxin system
MLWWIDDPAQIHENARLEIANSRNTVCFSAMSFVEIAIKEATGKLKVPETSPFNAPFVSL